MRAPVGEVFRRRNERANVRVDAPRLSTRNSLLRQAWEDIGIVFVVGAILDLVYQLTTLHRVYPGEAIIVVILLALVS